MSIFSRIFGNKKNISLTDPVFGVIEFNGVLWSHIPSNSQENFMIVIDAPVTGPSDIQREYYKKLIVRFHSLICEVKEFINIHQKSDFDATQLNIYSVEIGCDAEMVNNNFVIELSDNMANEIHRIAFENNKPVSYTIDD